MDLAKPALALLILSTIFAGCIAPPMAYSSEPVCNKPYILVGTECCLDKNANSICDFEEAIADAEKKIAEKEAADKAAAEKVTASKEAEQAKATPTPEPKPAGCTNTCASTFNQNPYPDCTCVAAIIPTATPLAEANLSTPSNATAETNATIVPTPTLALTPTPTPTPTPTATPVPTPTPTPTPVPACTGASFSSLTSGLMNESNACRTTRVAGLCSACPTCCSNPTTEKTEYAQSTDASCYSCAYKVYGVSRARDYYDAMGAYEKVCTPCTAKATAYSSILNYSAANACTVSSGWQFCKDVNNVLPAYAANCNGSIYSALTTTLLAASNACTNQRVAGLCSACSTCCTNPTTAKTEYEQSIDATCYSCTEKVYGVARARDYYGKMGTYSKVCAGCTDLVNAYTALLQYGKDYSCSFSGWQICNDVVLP